MASPKTQKPTAEPTEWKRKDLIGIEELSAGEINTVLDTAAAFKQVGVREIKKVPALRGKTLVNFFVEPSTRTRTSFELAAFRLSADVINIAAPTSSLTKAKRSRTPPRIQRPYMLVLSFCPTVPRARPRFWQ